MTDLIKIAPDVKNKKRIAKKGDTDVKPKKTELNESLRFATIEAESNVIIEKPKRIKKQKMTLLDKKTNKIEKNLNAIQKKADAFKQRLFEEISRRSNTVSE